jgi:hypothetical protein
VITTETIHNICCIYSVYWCFDQCWSVFWVLFRNLQFRIGYICSIYSLPS